MGVSLIFSGRLERSPVACKRIIGRVAAGIVLALAIGCRIADMEAGRLVVDEPLANRVRSGRKQP
jgi:hypothetical protein